MAQWHNGQSKPGHHRIIITITIALFLQYLTNNTGKWKCNVEVVSLWLYTAGTAPDFCPAEWLTEKVRSVCLSPRCHWRGGGPRLWEANCSTPALEPQKTRGGWQRIQYSTPQTLSFEHRNSSWNSEESYCTSCMWHVAIKHAIRSSCNWGLQGN